VPQFSTKRLLVFLSFVLGTSACVVSASSEEKQIDDGVTTDLTGELLPESPKEASQSDGTVFDNEKLPRFSQCNNFLSKLVDIPEGLARQVASNGFIENVPKELMEGIPGTEQFQKWYLSAALLPVLRRSEAKAILKFGTIDHFMPVLFTTDETASVCRSNGCLASMWIKDFTPSSRQFFGPTKIKFKVDAGSTITALAAHTSGSAPQVGAESPDPMAGQYFLFNPVHWTISILLANKGNRLRISQSKVEYCGDTLAECDGIKERTEIFDSQVLAQQTFYFWQAQTENSEQVKCE
jgi:hypothetical protein